MAPNPDISVQLGANSDDSLSVSSVIKRINKQINKPLTVFVLASGV